MANKKVVNKKVIDFTVTSNAIIDDNFFHYLLPNIYFVLKQRNYKEDTAYNIKNIGNWDKDLSKRMENKKVIKGWKLI